MRSVLYIKPNAAAIKAARLGLLARKKAKPSKRGGLDLAQAHQEGVGSGVARARDIASGKRINAYQVKAFFDRHRNNYINAKLKKLKPEESKAIQAWLLWGGEPLRKQVEKAVKKDRSAVKNPKYYVVYVTVEQPKDIIVYPFRSDDVVVPSMVANEYRLKLKGRYPDADIRAHDAKHLASYLKRVKKPIKRGKRLRESNPRRSILKDALAVEALAYNNFEAFAKSYWENCARGIYWYPTDRKDFSIGQPEKELSQKGKFVISCNPELALDTERGKGKNYVAELDTSSLGSGDYRIQRKEDGSKIAIIRNINKVKVLRVLRSGKAMRSLIWQQSILPSSKEELRKFYRNVVAKEKARLEKEGKKKEERRERDRRREKFLEGERASKGRRKAVRKEAEQKVGRAKVKEKIESKIRKSEFEKTRAKVKDRKKVRVSKGKKKSKRSTSKAMAKSNPGRYKVPIYWI